jgi:NADH-quinone oxidoreductase subunit L
LNETYQILVLVSLFAPLASLLTTSLPARKHEKLISCIAILFTLSGFATAAILLFIYWHQTPIVLRFDWFHTGSYAFTADLLISNRSVLMLAVVSFVSLLVHIYSTVYMAGDADLKRFFAMLGFFTFSMQGIVLSDNFLFLFIFWELVGFSSYMLIGHWTKNPAAGHAATKAFVMNRIGDAGFLVGLMIIWTTYNSFSITDISGFPAASGWQTAAALCIFCGVIGKSAQFPLFTWLPDAMEGPTPVSALIHAATMVAAGVYLLVRVFGLFTQDALLVVAITGMVTTIMGALAALSQYDIKKILAYSTMSQLGLMILAIGMGVVDAAFLHLLTHAFFKACLFLSAGMIMHALHKAQTPNIHFNPQDIRNLGGLRHHMPVAFITFLISGASLAGVPFFSGFLSKEAILLSLFMHTNVMSWLMLVVIISVSFLTVMYTFRLIWFVFMSQKRAIAQLIISEPNWIMRAPVAILALCSLWFMVSWNPFDVRGWMLPRQQTSAYAIWVTLFSIVWVIAALMLSWYIHKKGTFKTNKVFRNSFYIDKAYNAFSGKTVHASSRAVTWFERSVIDGGIHAMVYVQVIVAHVVAWVDRVFVDGTVNGTARLTGFGGKITRSFQGGNIQLYIFWAVFAIIIFIIWALKY